MGAEESRVAVKVFGHKTKPKLELILKTNDNIATLKKGIYKETEIRPENQILLLQGVEVKERFTLADCTTSGRTGPLLLHQRFDIFVKNSADNYTLQLCVETRHSVVDIKHKINERISNASSAKQILLLGNCELDDTNTVADYNITHGTVLLLYHKIAVTVQHREMKRPLTLNLGTNNTIKTLKEKIYHLNKGIKPANQILIYKKEELNDKRILASYKISSGAVLSLHKGFEIYVRNASYGKKILLFVGEQDTVMELKNKICKPIGYRRDLFPRTIKQIKPEDQILMFGEYELNDIKTVGDYKITPGTEILLHQKIKIKVQLGKETPMEFDVETRNTIAAIKQKIFCRKRAFITDNQILICGKDELDNSKTLADYSISSGALLSLHLRLTISVRNEQDLTLVQLRVKTCDKIASIKRQFFDKTMKIDSIDDIWDIADIQTQPSSKPQPENQILIFSNKELEDNKTVADYNISEGAVLSLHQRFKIRVRRATDNNLLPLIVGTQDTVTQLKKEIGETIKEIEPEDQILMFGEYELNDIKTVGDYKITPGTELLLHEKIKIKVQYEKGAQLEFVVETINTTETIKHIIYDHIKVITPANQILIYDKDELEDSKTLANYKISSGAVLSLYQKLLITVKNKYDGTSLQLRVKPRDKISNLKLQIFNIKNDIQPENQILVFINKELEDNKTVADYNISGGAVLLLHQRIEIFVENPADSKLLKLIFKTQDTVASLKHRIYDHCKIAIKPANQILIYEASKLDDKKTLADYMLLSGNVLLLDQNLKIKVQSEEGSPLSLDVETRDTIGTLKRRINEIKNAIAPDEQILIYENTELDDSCTLANYKISSEVKLSLHKRILIDVKNEYDGNSRSLRVKTCDTIANLKLQIHGIDNAIETANQILIYRGDELEDSKIVADYKIPEGAVVSFHTRILVHVKNEYDGKSRSLRVKTCDTIANLKLQIHGIDNAIETANQILIYKEDELEDNNIVADYKIPEGAVVSLHQKIRIKVKHGEETPQTIYVDTRNTIGTLKHLIHDRNKAITPADQILINNEDELDDSKTIAYCKISSGAVLLLIQRTVSLPRDPCKICEEAESDCAFIACGHIFCCTVCASKLQACPVCRKISKFIKIYRA